MTVPELTPADAVIAVDVQNDFCPDGSLPVAEGDQVVDVLNRWIAAAARGGALVVLTRDWHPPGHVSFQQSGGPWPQHCVQSTPGAAFHADLQVPPLAWLVSKGVDVDRDCYSGFAAAELAAALRRHGVERVWIGGLALDVCVQAAAQDALQAGFEVHLIRGATRAVDRAAAEDVIHGLRRRGAIIENGAAHG